MPTSPLASMASSSSGVGSPPALTMSKRSAARSRRNASAICVRHEFPVHGNKTFDLIMATCLLLAKGDNGLGFDGLVAGAALGVEKTKKLFQRLGVGGVPEKRALAAHLDQLLILELFQVVRKG